MSVTSKHAHTARARVPHLLSPPIMVGLSTTAVTPSSVSRRSQGACCSLDRLSSSANLTARPACL